MTLAPSLKTTSRLEHIFLKFQELEPTEKEFLTQHSHWKILKIFEEINYNKGGFILNKRFQFPFEEISNIESFFNASRKQPSYQLNTCKHSSIKQIEQLIETIFFIRIPRKLTTTETSSIVYLPSKSTLIGNLSNTYDTMLQNPIYAYIRPLYISKIEPTTATILRQIADLLDSNSHPNFDFEQYTKIKFNSFSDDEIFYTLNFLEEFQRILKTTEIQTCPPSEAAMNIALRSAKLFPAWGTALKSNPDPEIRYAVKYLKAIYNALNLYIE